MRHVLFGQAGYQPYLRIIYPAASSASLQCFPFITSIPQYLSLRVDIKRCLIKVVHDAVDLFVSGNCIHDVFSGGNITVVDQGKQVF